MIKYTDISNSTVFVRVDFNVPIFDGIILNTTRINNILPIVVDLLKNNNKVVLASHLGRPMCFDLSFSLKIVYDYICEELNQYKIFFAEKINESYKDLVTKLNFGEILILENLRFYQEEESCDENFMKFLASSVDYYCNEAFSCSHRAHASIMMAKFFDQNHKFLGHLFQKEMDAIDNFLNNRSGKSIAIIGGSKISSKIHLLLNLQTKVDYIFIIGAMANTLLKCMAFEVGKSLIEENCDEMIRNLVNSSKINCCEIILPDDFVVTDSIKNPTYIRKTNQIKKNDIIVDIGDDSIKKLKKLLESCKNVLWNGPAGVFEVKPFDEGTLKIAKIITDFTEKNEIESIIGGGDTIASIDDELLRKFTYVSTAGGAFLEYVEGDRDVIGLSVMSE